MAETWNLLPPPSYFFVLLSTFGLLVCLSLHCLSRFQRHIHKMWTFSEGRDNERSWVNIWLFLMSICTASKVSSSFLVSVCLECGEIEILRFHRFECRWAHVYGFLFVFRLVVFSFFFSGRAELENSKLTLKWLCAIQSTKHTRRQVTAYLSDWARWYRNALGRRSSFCRSVLSPARWTRNIGFHFSLSIPRLLGFLNALTSWSSTFKIINITAYPPH